jgi:serine/threonine protein kinase
MSWANGGSLEEFVAQRSGRQEGEAGGRMGTKERQKERVRAKRRGGGSERAIHLLRVEDLLHLFRDVVVGLAFLHSKNILHLDLKVRFTSRKRLCRRD